MKPSIYLVEYKGPGAIYIMPKPSGEWLDEDIAFYGTLAVGLIVSLLEASEIDELSLRSEELVCANRGMDFRNFPIPDRGLPVRSALEKFIDELNAYLQKDVKIAIHCRAGIGRTGLVAGCLLQKTGITAQRAIDLLNEARGVSIPDTDEQKEFIYRYSS